MASKQKDDRIWIPEPQRSGGDVYLIGTSPFICNRMSEKAKRELLLPTGRKTAAQRAASLKHDPIEEFRHSPYTLPDTEPTLLGIHSASVKRAMAAAALDVPGANKSQIGRLVWAENQYSNYVSIYGIPQLMMTITRMADINRTPDVRTFAVIPNWVVKITMSWIEPQLNETSVLNLLSMAGYTIGIGDGRPEKGKLSFGQFRVAMPDDPEVLEIMASGQRIAQEEAMDAAIPYDQESAELLDWYQTEVVRLGRSSQRANGGAATATTA